MPRLLLATKNPHKTAEIRAILGEGWDITDLSTHPSLEMPEETGATFEENARIKADAVSRVFPGLVLSDDSGLEVDALGGAPGVHSARFAGIHGNDAANRTRLKQELDACGRPEPWAARFRCAMALAGSGSTRATFEGRVEGRVISGERGSGGFGYDPLFVPAGFLETFGELLGETKNGLSHRARALAMVIEYLRDTSPASLANNCGQGRESTEAN